MMTDAKSMYRRSMEVCLSNLFDIIKKSADQGNFSVYVDKTQMNPAINPNLIGAELGNRGFVCEMDDKDGMKIRWDQIPG